MYIRNANVEPARILINNSPVTQVAVPQGGRRRAHRRLHRCNSRESIQFCRRHLRAVGEVDDDSLRRVIDLFIDAGVNGVTALGVTSEVARLNDRERQRVLDVVISHVAGRVPSSPARRRTARAPASSYSRARERRRRRGGDGQPAAHAEAQLRRRRPRTTQAFADAVDIADHRPGLSADFRLRDGTVAARADRERVPRARTIKLEDPPTPFKTSRILEQAAGIDVRIFGGLGGVFLLEELMAGRDRRDDRLCLSGDPRADRHALPGRASRRRGRRVLSGGAADALRVPGGIGMAIRKEVLHRRGALASPATRAPAARLDQTTREALDRVMAWVETVAWHVSERTRSGTAWISD